jgi:hypothetical protein
LKRRWRLRLELMKEGRLNFPVLGTLNDAVDRSLLFPLVDVLEGYDGDPARCAEIELALQCLSRAADDVADRDRLRAKRALEHLRDVGAGSGVPMLPIAARPPTTATSTLTGPCARPYGEPWSTRRTSPSSLGTLRRPGGKDPTWVQVLVKNDEPYFVLYMLRDGRLARSGHGAET